MVKKLVLLNLPTPLAGYHDAAPYGGVKQTMTLVPGQQYHLSFYLGSSDYWNNYDNRQTKPTISVGINGNTLQTFTGIGYEASVFEVWQYCSLDFVAQGASTEVLLQGGSIGDRNLYIGLDNVSITAVPEPTTIITGALMLLPFGVSSIRAMRKNRP